MSIPQKRKIITIYDEEDRIIFDNEDVDDDGDDLVLLIHERHSKMHRTNSNIQSGLSKKPTDVTSMTAFAKPNWRGSGSLNLDSNASSSKRSVHGSFVQHPPRCLSSPNLSHAPSIPRAGCRTAPIDLGEDEIEESSSWTRGSSGLLSKDVANSTSYPEDESYLELENEEGNEDHHTVDPYAGAIELTDDESDDDQEPYANAIELMDDDDEERLLLTSIHSKPRRKSTIYPQRNPPIIYPLTIKPECFLLDDLRLVPGDFIEKHDGDFMRIATIVWNHNTRLIALRGHRLMRTSEFNGMLEKKLNELCYFFEVDLDDPRPALEQSMHEIAIGDVRRVRSVRATNQKFPLDRNLGMPSDENSQIVGDQGGLTVRWKYTCKYASAKHRRKNDFAEKVFERIRYEETRNPILSDEGLKREWRGETVPGGAYMYRSHCTTEPVGQLADQLGPVRTTMANKRRTPSQRVSKLASGRQVSTEGEPLRRGDIEDARVRFETMSFDDLRSAQNNIIPTKRQEGINAQALSHGKEKEGCPVLNIMPEEEHFPVKPFRERVPSKCPRHLVDMEQPSLACIDLTAVTAAELPVAPSKVPGQTYTYGDAFCGCGGTTRGAVMAGLRVIWGFDGWAIACNTWRENFPEPLCYQLRAHEFVQLAERSTEYGFPDMMKVDILHLSPPCQFFSDAHTIDGKDDEINRASLFSVGAVIAASKPRVVTLEQTFGITRPRFRLYLASLINMYTSLGFSVRWAVVPLAQWGLPQKRRRLIMIASCPGEILPRLPPPTHDEDGRNGLKPFISVNTSIRRISPNNPHNNPEDARFRENRLRPAWDGDSILPRTMTTSGGQNYHPSGRRDFTRAEYAAVQGFPETHKFLIGGTYIKKQIGNAVPPCVAKVMFESIKEDLNKADGMADEKEVLLIE